MMLPLFVHKVQELLKDAVVVEELVLELQLVLDDGLFLAGQQRVGGSALLEVSHAVES